MTDLKRVIAYSTMSQIGYMIMGVSLGAYSAGLFHLMTHAFFKALLFMAAGSVIGAMAGEQSLDKMGGFRKRAAVHVHLLPGRRPGAVAGCRRSPGWLSKDDIIAFLDHRGGGFEILGIVGYVGALLTGIYTFRMIFRAFFGEPCPEAVELEHGHLAHAEVPRNPMTGEEEDTDVGFPGPGALHRRARVADEDRDGRARGARRDRRPDPDPRRRRRRHQVPRPDVRRLQVRTTWTSRPGPAWVGLVIGALIAVAGIAIAYRIWVAQPGTVNAAARAVQRRILFLSHKWYFDELIDFAIVRPVLWIGRLVDTVLERERDQPGVVTGGDDRRRARRLGRRAPRPDRLPALLRRR